VEVILSSTPVSTGNFKWTSTFNVTANKNKVLDLGFDPSGKEEIKVIYTGTNTFNGNNSDLCYSEGRIIGPDVGAEVIGNMEEF
jgi:hypothetical protein